MRSRRSLWIGVTMYVKHLWIPLFISLIALFPFDLTAGPANPGPIQATQPDGTEISIRALGDEWYHFYESSDGYAIVVDEDQWWVYADLDGKGRFIPTRHLVGLEDRAAAQYLGATGKHLREYHDETINRRAHFYERTMPGILDSAAKSLGDKATGTFNIPVVLIQYPDYAGTQLPASFTNMMNQPGYNGTGSFQDYYTQVSNGQLQVAGSVVGWYTAPFNRHYYREGNGTITQINRSRDLARRATILADSLGLNWGPFDNDGNGSVDVVFVVHQGPGAECGAPADTNYVWSHAGYYNPLILSGGLTSDRYIMVPEEKCGGGHEEIGIFAHEFGHILGLPDLYDTVGGNGWSAGIGMWGLMGYGHWGYNFNNPQTPSLMCAWSRAELQWVTPINVTSNMSGVAIHPGNVFKLWTNGNPGTEYFLVENRQQAGFDYGLPGSGLAIWHIDENKRSLFNTDNGDASHKLVDLEEADGLAQMDALTSYGDAGDLFPGSTSNTLFGGLSNPNSMDYTNSATMVSVSNITQLGSLFTADFAVTSATGAPNLMIRDCLGDTGMEPTGLCLASFNRSPDIWIDNNSDGVIDAPIPGQVNRLYARAWNGGTPTTNVDVKFYYMPPTLAAAYGMGGGGILITDAYTGLSQITIPTMGTVMPSAGGTGVQNYINWMIPPNLPGINHYMVGVVVDNGADPQFSPIPFVDNNLAHMNYADLSLAIGAPPVKGAEEAQNEVVFHQEIMVANPYDVETEFLVQVEGLDLVPNWVVLPEPEIQIIVPPGGEVPVIFDIIKHEPSHRDSARVRHKLYKIQGMELVDSIDNVLAIDDLPPLPVGDWEFKPFRPNGDDLFRPLPTGKLSWEENPGDVGGFPERIRFYEIYGSENRNMVEILDPSVLLDENYGDDDPDTPGFQYHLFDDLSVPRYYSVVPVDMAGNRGAAAPILSPENPLSSVPEITTGRVSQNYPNPFNPLTKIDFDLVKAERVRITIYNAAGEMVKELENRLYAPGSWSVSWDGKNQSGSDVASGVYFMKLESASLKASKKMTLVR